jgi:hypothetical protein
MGSLPALSCINASAGISALAATFCGFAVTTANISGVESLSDKKNRAMRAEICTQHFQRQII